MNTVGYLQPVPYQYSLCSVAPFIMKNKIISRNDKTLHPFFFLKDGVFSVKGTPKGELHLFSQVLQEYISLSELDHLARATEFVSRTSKYRETGSRYIVSLVES